jgi:transposase-like protein
MKTDTSILAFQHPDEIDDPLTSVLREGARRLLAQAIEAEAESFLATMQGERLADGRARVVRHGHGPERAIQTGIGAVPVRRAKLRDRGAGEVGGERITFTSALLPKWARRTRSLDALLPVLYLRGISTGDFQEALAALLGKDAPSLSPSVIGRLKEEWQVEYDRWQRRELSARRYVYIWADGVYLQARMEDDAACMLVIVGATPQGRKELVGSRSGLARAPRAGVSCSSG